jgi:hypothetical protein
MQKGHDVADRLRGEAAREHRARKALDVCSRHVVNPTLADGRRNMDALHRLAVLPVRRARALNCEASAQLVRDLVDGPWPLLDRRARAESLRFDQPTQASLRLAARETASLAAHARLANASVHAASVRGRPTPVIRAPLHVESPGPMGTFHAPQRTGLAITRPPAAKDCPRIVPVRVSEPLPRTTKAPGYQGFRVIGETGFEPATARPPAGCATRLRHSP